MEKAISFFQKETPTVSQDFWPILYVHILKHPSAFLKQICEQMKIRGNKDYKILIFVALCKLRIAVLLNYYVMQYFHFMADVYLLQ